ADCRVGDEQEAGGRVRRAAARREMRPWRVHAVGAGRPGACQADGVDRQAGLRTEAVMTDMDAPLGRAVGNAVEIIECVETLKGQGPADIHALVIELAARLLIVSGKYRDPDASPAVRDAISSGRALEKMRSMIAWQKGDTGIVDDYSRLSGARGRHAVKAARTGYIMTMKADLIGRA